jgi:Mrp family chromosome partitioning ATPase
VRTDGIETLIAVARRSRWIILILVVLGASQMDIIRQVQGASYQATARVILSPVDLASALAGFSGYVDPQLVDNTEQALADSPQLFARTAALTHGRLGSGSEIAGITSASKSGTTLSFTATGGDPARVVRTANAVASAYPSWRASVSSNKIAAAIAQLQSQLHLQTTKDPNLVEQLNRLELLKTLSSGNTLLVESAGGAAKTRPRPIRDTVLGAFIGFFVALVLVGIREALDTKVRSEGEVEGLLNIPVVATVEALPRQTTLVGFGRDRERFRDMYALLAAGVVQARKDKPRTIIAVTSATPDEGKTTTASNLAAALAHRNAHVVLVDMDSRKPDIARMFRLPPNTAGMEKLIWREADLNSLMWDVSLNGSGVTAHPSRNGGGLSPLASLLPEEAGSLQVIPMGPHGPSDFAAHIERLQPVIDELGTKADYVVIDTPPALSVPDVTELTKYVDVVLIVVRHGRVSRRSLAALNRLHRTWPEVDVNAVLVGTPPHGDTYAYYGAG